MFNCKYIFNINEGKTKIRRKKSMKYLITKTRKRKTHKHTWKYSIKVIFLLKEKQKKSKNLVFREKFQKQIVNWTLCS